MKKVSVLLSVWSVCGGFSGCVVKEECPHHHYHHHDRVIVEERRPVVEEKIEVRYANFYHVKRRFR